MVRQTDLEIEDSATSNYIVRQIALETEYTATVYITSDNHRQEVQYYSSLSLVRLTTIDSKCSVTVGMVRLTTSHGCYGTGEGRTCWQPHGWWLPG